MPHYSINDLLTLMTRLREPVYGCPWDQVQNYHTIAPSTLEEAYEVVDAIEQGDKQQLREELGDLLFQVIFYSELGQEEGVFSFASIVSQLTEKLIRRHPHVFPDGTLESRIADNVTEADGESTQGDTPINIKAAWESRKSQERQGKGHHSLLDDVPLALPAVVRANKLQKRAASAGFDWQDSAGVYKKLDEEIIELKNAQLATDKVAIEDELGDLLFTVVNLARHLKVDPETALRRSNTKFEQRFRLMETQALLDKVDLSSLTDNELNTRWERAKQIFSTTEANP
jgi:nucleoside triphosphate diphosphatase